MFDSFRDLFLVSTTFLYLFQGVQAPIQNGSQSASLGQSHLNSSEEPSTRDRAQWTPLRDLFSSQYFPYFGKRAKISWMLCSNVQTLAILFSTFYPKGKCTCFLCFIIKRNHCYISRLKTVSLKHVEKCSRFKAVSLIHSLF